MIDRFDADDARRDRRRVELQMLEEFQLGGRGADDQDLTGVLYCVGDLLVVGVILGRPARSDRTLFVMKMLVLRLGMDDTRLRIVRVELDDMRFAVVDPHDTVIVAHRGLLPRDRSFKYTAVTPPFDSGLCVNMVIAPPGRKVTRGTH